MSKKKTKQNTSWRDTWEDPEGNTVPQDRTDNGMHLSTFIKFVWTGNANQNVQRLVSSINKLAPDPIGYGFRTAKGAYDAIRAGEPYLLSISDDKIITVTPKKT